MTARPTTPDPLVPLPLPRIGDSERERAAEALREHYAAGRLDAAEHEERLTAALSARTQPELDVLFRDLPAPWPPRPVGAVPPAARRSPQPPPWQHQQRRRTGGAPVWLLALLVIAVIAALPATPVFAVLFGWLWFFREGWRRVHWQGPLRR